MTKQTNPDGSILTNSYSGADGMRRTAQYPGKTVSTMIWDGSSMAMSVVYSNAFGGIIAKNRGGVVSDYVQDPLGSTIGLMDSTGTLTDRWEYWP